MVILFIITTVMSPMVSSAGLKFGIISVVKDKVEELREKKEEKEKEVLVIETKTSSNGEVTFYDSKADKNITVCTTDASSEAPVGEIDIQYFNTSDNIICVANDPAANYYSNIYIIPLNGFSSAPEHRFEVKAIPLVIPIVLYAVAAAPAIYEFVTDPPYIERISLDGFLIKVEGTCDANDLIALVSLIPILNVKLTIAKGVYAVAKAAGGEAIKYGLETVVGIDFSKKYKFVYRMVPLLNIPVPPLYIEEELSEETVLTNVALNKPTTASGVWYDDPITGEDDLPEKAVDGNMNTRWNNDGFNNPTASWWQVDLEQSYNVEKIIIKWYGISATNFKLQYWNGDSWQAIVDFDTGTTSPEMYSGDAGVNTFEFSPISTDKVRFYSDSLYADTNGNNTVTFWEFEVYADVE